MQADGGARRKSPSVIWLAASLLLFLSSAGGGGILAWWFLSFHRENQRLWMVPLGLVVLGAPLLACLSISFSQDGCRWVVQRSVTPPPPVEVATVVTVADPER
ncbi:hypothetical protein IEQ34_005959 [Dendrobium chrysotoxum]|uniref:Uncharacterized protein n=1 Tax=Dendrobium chrysotoxum TaxID=161865 RepID=A0AAV7HA02_DENCH|nr:hypothetical protein IEQ34_005959 [Dendrobium chrysotoxum]